MGPKAAAAAAALNQQDPSEEAVPAAPSAYPRARQLMDAERLMELVVVVVGGRRD